MRRTSIFLDSELEVLLKLEAHRTGRPMAELVREALHAYLKKRASGPPPGAGAFRSGRRDTAADVDQALASEGFGRKG